MKWPDVVAPPVIVVFRNLRQAGHKFEASLDNLVKLKSQKKRVRAGGRKT